jgi:hypothetical protein
MSVILPVGYIEPSKLEDARSKLTGVLILGVMCSATKEDQTGMLAVDRLKQKYAARGLPMPPTLFEFKNGSELVITEENFDAVDLAWMTFRQEFFKP